jgi:cyclophilin family peptidyl-prolyl cis-trans isomerase
LVRLRGDPRRHAGAVLARRRRSVVVLRDVGRRVGAAVAGGLPGSWDQRAASRDEEPTCAYLPSTTGAVIDVGLPAPKVPASGTVALEMATNSGPIRLVLGRALAPCASASVVHLAEQRFFDGTPCHPMVSLDTFGVLQCGDPTGTGTGGPAYRYAEEVGPSTTYPRGTVAMANSGTPASTGSQFFLCFTVSELSPGTRRSARSMRPDWPCSTTSRRRATTGRSKPAAAARPTVPSASRV